MRGKSVTSCENAVANQAFLNKEILLAVANQSFCS